MLLSFSHKFIFIANLKSGSTSIERALGPFAEIHITQTQFGKHDPLSMISKKFQWVKRYVPHQDFFVFGVMREPVDFILSLYNFHSSEDFAGLRQYSGGVSFAEFWDGWCTKSWQTRPQHVRFIDKHGLFRTKHVIDFADLDRDFPRVCALLGVNARLQQSNRSPQVLTRNDLSATQIAAIEERHADDYQFLQNRPRVF